MRPITEGATRILVIQPDREAAARLRTMLEPRGYSVRVAYDGLSGLAASQAEDFGLIILDVSLPGLDGPELVARLRRERRTATVPVLVLASSPDLSLRVSFFEQGVDDFLVMPVSPLELLSRIQAQLRRQATATPEEPGKVVAFLGCSGGIGTTTICANIAQALATRGPTVALDSAWPLGGLAQLLAAPPREGLRQMAAAPEADRGLQSYLSGGYGGLRFQFLSGLDALVPDPPVAPDVAGLLHEARQAGRYVLVDLGTCGAPFAPDLLGAADLVVLIIAFERAHVSRLAGYIELTERLGVRRSRRLVVGNRLRPSPLGVREMQRAIDDDIATVIPYEGDRLAQCLGEGVLLLTQFPASAAAIALAELASQISRQSVLET